MNNYQKPERLKKLEQQLYSKNSDIRPKDRQVFQSDESNVPQNWVDEVNSDESVNPLKKENQRKMSWFSKLLIGSFIFFLVALSYAFYIFNFSSSNEGQDVDIKINSPISVSAGEEFTFDIVIENNNAIEMDSIDLIIEYPEGTRDGKDISINMPRERSDIGAINSGTFLRETKTVYLFGEEGDTKNIDVKIVYRVKDSNAVFEKKKKFDVLLKSTPVRVNISSLKEITAGQLVDFELEVISNSNETINNLLLKADYPFGFIFGESSLETHNSDNMWLIEKLEPKEKILLKISGEMQGQNNDLKYFKFDTGLANENKDDLEVVFTSVGKSLVIERPFLELDIAIGNDNSDIFNLDSGNVNTLKIIYKNNTGSVIEDAKIELKIEGDVVNETSIRSGGGFYDSNTKTIYWDSSTLPDLNRLVVGQSGSITVNLSPESLVSSTRYKNPELNLSAIVRGNRFQDNDVPEEIVNEIFKTIRYNTVVLLDKNSVYFDGPFENSGPIPPKVGEETTYTILFALSNSSNTISNGIMEIKLPNYVRYKDQVWPSGRDVKYDEVTRTVTWNIGEVKDNIGFNADKLQMAFQVSIVPSISQRGTAVLLASDINFTSIDLFTGEQIKKFFGGINTAIADLRNYGDDKVTQ